MTDEIRILVLLQEGISWSNIEGIEGVVFQSAKRVSRSENLWMLTIDKVKKSRSELEKLVRDREEVIKIVEKNSTDQNSVIEVKSSKSTPIKN